MGPQSKMAAYFFLAIALGVAIGMSLFVVVHGQNHQQPMQKAFFAHSALASARKINIAMGDSESEGELKKGKVKWFDTEKGFGFIEVEGDQDYFVHQTAIYAPGFRSLAEGEDVEFKVGTDERTGKVKALDVTGPGGNYVQGAPRPDANDGGYGGYEEEGSYDSYDE